jgi:hypothetical protein
MRETLACAAASTATAARTTGHARRRGLARQVGEPRSEWCAVVHLTDTISGRLERGPRGARNGRSGEGEGEMCRGGGGGVGAWVSF